MQLPHNDDPVEAFRQLQRLAVDHLYTVSPEYIEQEYIKCLVEKKDLGVGPWHVFLWHMVLKPYGHGGRKHYINMSGIMDAIWRSPHSLWLFGTLYMQNYSEDVEKALSPSPNNKKVYSEWWTKIQSNREEPLVPQPV